MHRQIGIKNFRQKHFFSRSFASTALALAVISLTQQGCGETRFGSAGSKNKETPPAQPAETAAPAVPEPALVKPGERPGKVLETPNVGSRTVGGPTTVSGIGKYTTVRGTGTVTSAAQLPTTFTTLAIPATSATSTPISYIGTFSGAQDSRPPCPNGIVLGNRCLDALKIFQWKKEERRYFTTKADDKCTRFNTASCGGINIAENGFAYENLLGSVFKETAIDGISREGNSAVRIVICHKSSLSVTEGDTILVNPNEQQVSALSGECGGGAESVILLAKAASGTAPLFVWKKESHVRLAFSGSTPPSSGYTLDSQSPVGYAVQP